MTPTKKIGIGSISLPLCIIGLVLSLSFENKICYGDIILNFLGLKAWSNGTYGTHYTIFYSFILIILSFIIAYKFDNDLESKLGIILPTIIFIVISLLSVLKFII